MKDIKTMKLDKDKVTELQLYDIEKIVTLGILNNIESANTYNDFCIRRKPVWISLNKIYCDKLEKFNRLRDSIIQEAETSLGCKIQDYYINYGACELEYTE